MAIIGSDFNDYPMGAAWEGAQQTERDRYIRMALGRLNQYSITNDTELTIEQEAALSAYVRILFDLQGVGAPEPPEFLLNSLRTPIINTAGPFSLRTLAEGAGSSTPSTPGGGTDEATVRMIVEQLVANWAEEGNDDAIPAEKLANIPQTTLDIARVEAAIRRLIEDWAETGNAAAIPGSKLTNQGPNPESWAEDGNTDQIPSDKLGNQGPNPESWAQEGNTDQIPANKLGNAPSGGGTAMPSDAEFETLQDYGADLPTGSYRQLGAWQIPTSNANMIVVINVRSIDNINNRREILRFEYTAAELAALPVKTQGTLLGSGIDYELPGPRTGSASNANLFIARTATNELLANATRLGVSIRIEKIVGAGGGGSGGGTGDDAFDWATEGNNDPIPSGKLANQGPNPLSWAQQGNTDAIPAGKLANQGPNPDTWAQTGNLDAIPRSKLGNAPQRTDSSITTLADDQITTRVQNWALDDSTPIPADKLVNAPGTGGGGTTPQENVDIGSRNPSFTWDNNGYSFTVGGPGAYTPSVTVVAGEVYAATGGVVSVFFYSSNVNGGSGFVSSITPSSGEQFTVPANAIRMGINGSSGITLARITGAEMPMANLAANWALEGNTDPIPFGKLGAFKGHYDSGATYSIGHVVAFADRLYVSGVNNNTDNEPATHGAQWRVVGFYKGTWNAQTITRGGDAVFSTNALFIQTTQAARIGTDPAMDDGTHFFRLENAAEWARPGNTDLIPLNKVRPSSVDLGEFGPYVDEATQFFRDTYSHQHTETSQFQLADGISNLGSYFGDATDYSPSNTDGLIETGNAVFDDTDCAFSGLTNPTYGGLLVKARIRETGLVLGPSQASRIIMGFHHNNLDYPQLRINGTTGRLESNHTGSRTMQQWVGVSGLNPVTGTVEPIAFQAGSTVNVLVEWSRLQNGNVEFILAARQIGGSNPQTWEADNFEETNHALPVNDVRSDCRGYFEVWNAAYTTHQQQAQDLADNRIDLRGLGKVAVTTHATDTDTLNGDLNVVGTIRQNGEAVALQKDIPAPNGGTSDRTEVELTASRDSNSMRFQTPEGMTLGDLGSMQIRFSYDDVDGNQHSFAGHVAAMVPLRALFGTTLAPNNATPSTLPATTFSIPLEHRGADAMWLVPVSNNSSSRVLAATDTIIDFMVMDSNSGGSANNVHGITSPDPVGIGTRL